MGALPVKARLFYRLTPFTPLSIGQLHCAMGETSLVRRRGKLRWRACFITGALCFFVTFLPQTASVVKKNI